MVPNFQQLVLTTDLSDPSWDALAVARKLAEQFDSKLTIISVIEEPYYFSDVRLGQGVMELLKETEPVVRDRIETKLRELGISPDAVSIRVVRGTSPAHEILRLAEELDAGMIVMATRGRSGLAHVLTGSTTERVVRTSRIPVLTVSSSASSKSAQAGDGE